MEFQLKFGLVNEIDDDLLQKICYLQKNQLDIAIEENYLPTVCVYVMNGSIDNINLSGCNVLKHTRFEVKLKPIMNYFYPRVEY